MEKDYYDYENSPDFLVYHCYIFQRTVFREHTYWLGRDYFFPDLW